MGVNIHILRTTESGEEDLDFEADWWDTIRYTGDTDLYHDDTLDWEYANLEDNWSPVKRPRDWEAFRAWIDENVPEGNRPRWHECIERIQGRDDLWLEFSS